MKRIILVQLFVFLLLGNDVFPQSWISLDDSTSGEEYTISKIKSDITTHHVKVKIHGFYDRIVSNNGVEYNQIYLDKSGSLRRVGEPQLPVISQIIAIPEGATYRVSITEEKWKDISIGLIFPAQQDYKESEPEPQFLIHDSIYRKEYCPSIVRLSEEQTWRNIRNVGLYICPFKYFPAQRKLSVLTDFVLTVDFSNVAEKSSICADDISDATRWRMFDNEITGFPVEISNTGGAKSSDDYDYLILVGKADNNNPSILNSQALKDFRKWKALKGYKTKVVEVSSITTGTTPDAIKNYIGQEYSTKNVRNVLFIGDIDRIPVKVRSFTINNNIDTVKSDYWYACLNGSADYQAEIQIGRFSTNSLSDFQNMVNKTINYERFYSTGNYKKTLLVAHKEDAPGKYQGCCDSIFNTFTNQLTFTKAYGASNNYGGNDATNAQVVNYINSGMHIVNYRGHGMTTCWGINDNRWNTSNQLFEASQISSINSCSLYFNICCLTGNIEIEPCMMETFTRSSKGAIACLAATEEVYTNTNSVFNKQLFEKLFNNNQWNIGVLNNKAHLDAYYISENNIRAVYNAYAYICGGDPTLEIWTGSPSSFSNVSIIRSNSCLTVSSPSLDTGDVITLVSENGELLDKIVVTGNSSTFPIPSNIVNIGINRHNRYPYITQYNKTVYDQATFIQNQTISNNTNYNTSPIYIGCDVTGYIPYGNVVINSGGKLSIQNNSNGVTIVNGFECKSGGELDIE